MPVDLLSHSCSDEILIRQLIFGSQRTLIKYIYLDMVKPSSIYFFSNVMSYNRDHKEYISMTSNTWVCSVKYLSIWPQQPVFLKFRWYRWAEMDMNGYLKSYSLTILKETFCCAGVGFWSNDWNSWVLYSTFNSTINLTYDCVLAQIPQQHQWSRTSSL